MPFTSARFFLFLAAVVAAYFITPKKYQWITLLAASGAFYLLAGLEYALYLLFTIATTYGAGLWLGRLNQPAIAQEPSARAAFKAATKRRKQWILAAVLAANFGILFVVKYIAFTADNLNFLLPLLGMPAGVPRFDLLLPLGISFYTFQSMSYLIDVSRGKYSPERNPARLALFVSFFPQIVQGPIGRYDALAQQIYAPHTFDYDRARLGVQRILWGLFKKMVIADRAAVFVNMVIGNYTAYAGLYIPLAVVLYAVQIYTDFSGGIDIALGAAQILGIELAENFRRPYFARSIAEYWRRWHITLSGWMRDYLYYPLALSKGLARVGRKIRRTLGNRLGILFPSLVAEMIVFILIGVWHGPGWRFVTYGAYYGLLIILGLLFQPLMGKLTAWLQIRTDCFSWRLWQVIRTFGLTCFGRYISRAPSLRDAYQMMRLTVSTFNPWILFDGSLSQLGLDRPNLLLLGAAVGVLLLAEILQERGVNLRLKLAEQNILFQWAVVIAGILAVVIFGIYGQGYDPLRFIYEQF